MHGTTQVSNRCAWDHFIAGFNDQKNLKGKWGHVAPGIMYNFLHDRSVMYGLDSKKMKKKLYLTIACIQK